jgi:hypothetical protein
MTSLCCWATSRNGHCNSRNWYRPLSSASACGANPISVMIAVSFAMDSPAAAR